MFDLRKQLIFYSSYHNHPVSVTIHLICIWPLLVTAILMLQYTPTLAEMPDFVTTGIPFFKYVRLNLAFVMVCVYALCYLKMEPIVGAVGTLVLFCILTQTARLTALNANIYGFPVWNAALGLHAACWILRFCGFVGHGSFEGRTPALFGSLGQAFITGPLFVLMEVAFFLGYRRTFHDEVMIEVERNMQEFRAAKNK